MLPTFNHKILAKARKALRLTQSQTAQRAGISCRMYQRYESGAVVPGPEMLQHLAAAVEISQDELTADTKSACAKNEIQALVDIILEKMAHKTRPSS